MNLRSERITGYRRRRGLPPMESKTARESTRKTARRTITSPTIGSLFDIMHDNAGLSLFVPPLFWTDHHTRLLDCRFVQVPPMATQGPLSRPPPRSSQAFPLKSSLPTSLSGDDISAMYEALTVLMSPNQLQKSKNTSMKNLMSQLYPHKLTEPGEGGNLPMEFGNRRYFDAVGYQLVWDHKMPNYFPFGSTPPRKQLGGKSPILAYIVSPSNLDWQRRTRYFVTYLGPGGVLNIPVHRWNHLRYKQLRAKDPNENAYLVGCIIAMAQNKSQGSRIFGRGTRVNLISIEEETKSFIVYKTTVSAAFLAKFHDPAATPAGNSELVVEYTKVPTWPLMGLKERLSNALGVEFQDSFYLPPGRREQAGPMAGSPKRKRDPLSEMLNTSFSESIEPDVRRRMTGKAPRFEEEDDSP
ncbi:hypothetical protein F5Y14DRAFT_346016 [Nemania sp. NC0429]|nr:hypothetical protein F5Y14DRAFT_346016 [Nemania sp. NC0429]